MVDNNKVIADADLSNGMAGVMKMFEIGVSQFGEHVTLFSEAVAGIPSEMQITGTQNVNIVMNGVEVLAQMEPIMRELVTGIIRDEIRRSLGPATEGSSRLDAAGVGRGKKGGLR